MNYEFPRITKLDDVLLHIDEEHFVVSDKEGVTFINYRTIFDTTFPPVEDEDDYRNKVRRECRGIAFDTKSGLIVSRPFHKFFNLRERPECVYSDAPHIVLEKIDGSMVRPILYGGGVRWCTKAGITEVGMMAENFVADNSIYKFFAESLINHNLTPIFEYVGPYNRVVLPYKEDMVLLAIRENVSGDYMGHDYVKGYARQAGIPYASHVEFNDIEDIYDLRDQEGIVIRYDSGHMLKVKSNWYVNLHRAKDQIRTERRLVALVLNNQVDDVLPHLEADDTKYVNRVSSLLDKKMADLYNNVILEHNKAVAEFDTKKDYAIASKDDDPVIRNGVFKLWDKKVSVSNYVTSIFEKAIASERKWEDFKTKIKLEI